MKPATSSGKMSCQRIECLPCFKPAGPCAEPASTTLPRISRNHRIPLDQLGLPRRRDGLAGAGGGTYGNVPICRGARPSYLSLHGPSPAIAAARNGRMAREDSMRMLTRGALVLALGLPALAAAPAPAGAEDLLVTQYRADPSGAPYGVALANGFFAKGGVNITGIISGDGGGASVRSAMASELGYGDVSPAPAIAAIEQGQDIKI